MLTVNFQGFGLIYPEHDYDRIKDASSVWRTERSEQKITLYYMDFQSAALVRYQYSSNGMYDIAHQIQLKLTSVYMPLCIC